VVLASRACSATFENSFRNAMASSKALIPSGSAVVGADQPPVLGAAVAEVDELVRFQALDERVLDTLGFHSGEMAGEVLIGSPADARGSRRPPPGWRAPSSTDNAADACRDRSR
jgi:hypothetical protein